MIICGYPCIGKSTISKYSSIVIDLESSYFKVTGRDNTDWEIGYCKLAKQISDTGHMVFISTHSAVRNALKKLGFEFSLCYPALELKDIWAKRVTARAREPAMQKDKMAADRVINYYEEDIRDLMNTECKEHLVITKESLDDPERGFYDLQDIIF